MSLLLNSLCHRFRVMSAAELFTAHRRNPTQDPLYVRMLNANKGQDKL